MKTLIAYFSWSNNTRNLVEQINKSKGYDIYRIERKKPYSTDYNYLAYTEAKNEVDKNIHPEINAIPSDINDYDRILLFFPIWWYTIPMPVASFVEKLKGYKGEIVVFGNSFTNDYQYMKNSISDLKKANPSLDYKEGLFNKSVQEHLDFLK